MPCDPTDSAPVDDQSDQIGAQQDALMALLDNQAAIAESLRAELAALEQRVSDVVLARARRLALHPGDTIL